MKIHAFSVSVVAGAVLYSLAVPQATAAIVNGTFDTLVPSNNTGGGWTTSHIDGSGGWRDFAGTHGHVFGLNDAGQLYSDPTISQTVSGLIVGASYRVEGEYSTCWIGNPAVNGFAAGYDGNVLFIGGPTGGMDVWRPFSFVFVASGSTADIWMKGEYGGTDNDYVVDNISITQIAVPEPSSCVAGLRALGMLGLFWWSNRK